VSLLRPHRSPRVYRVRPGTTTDSDGDPVESWEHPDRLRLRNVTLQESSSEDEDGLAQRSLGSKRLTRSGRKIFVPYAADVVANDRVEIDGQLWRVDGNPNPRRGLATSVYTTVTLARLSD
jgi:hypothetical protein